MPFDPTQLAGLLAIATSPGASEQARQFLTQQKLQADEIAARERLSRAQIEADQLRQKETLGQQESQFTRSEGRLKQGQDEEAAKGRAQLGLQKQELDAGIAHQKVMETQGAGALANEQEQTRIQREKVESDIVQSAVDRAFTTYSSLQKERMANNGLGGGGAGGFAAKDFFSAMGPGAYSILGGPRPLKGESEKQAQARYLKDVETARQGYLSARAITSGGVLTPEGEASGSKDFEDLHRLLSVSMAGVPEHLRARAMAQVEAALNDPKTTLLSGGSLSPEQETEFIAKSSANLVKSAVDGAAVSPSDQVAFANYWAQQDQPAKKAEILDKVIDHAVASMKVANEWTDDQAVEFRGSLAAGISAALDGGQASILHNLVMPIAPKYDYGKPFGTQIGKAAFPSSADTESRRLGRKVLGTGTRSVGEVSGELGRGLNPTRWRDGGFGVSAGHVGPSGTAGPAVEPYRIQDAVTRALGSSTSDRIPVKDAVPALRRAMETISQSAAGGAVLGFEEARKSRKLLGEDFSIVEDMKRRSKNGTVSRQDIADSLAVHFGGGASGGSGKTGKFAK